MRVRGVPRSRFDVYGRCVRCLMCTVIRRLERCSRRHRSFSSTPVVCSSCLVQSGRSRARVAAQRVLYLLCERGHNSHAFAHRPFDNGEALPQKPSRVQHRTGEDAPLDYCERVRGRWIRAALDVSKARGRILSLHELLKRYNAPLTDESKLLQQYGKVTLQSLKKLLGLLDASTRYGILLDSESYFIRPCPLLTRVMAADHVLYISPFSPENPQQEAAMRLAEGMLGGGGGEQRSWVTGHHLSMGRAARGGTKVMEGDVGEWAQTLQSARILLHGGAADLYPTSCGYLQRQQRNRRAWTRAGANRRTSSICAHRYRQTCPRRALLGRCQRAQ